MLLIPAIDLIDGKVVRLVRGDFSKKTVYSDSPVKIAGQFLRLGVRRIHIVDLDAALKGKPQNLKALKQIAKAVKIDIEFGGGIRSIHAAARAFAAGAKFVIIGTKAFDRKFLKNIIRLYKDKVIVGLDTRNFKSAATSGWVKEEKTGIVDFLKELKPLGLSQIILTDISRDGTLKGPNIAAIKKMLKVIKIPVIVSGGVSSLDDIKKVKKLESSGVNGVISGKAIYEGRLDLKKALKLC